MGEWPAGGGSAIATFPLAASVGRPCKIGVDQSNNDVYPSGYGASAVANYTKASSYGSFTTFSPLDSGNNRVAINGTRHVAYFASPYTSKIQSYSTTTNELLETFTIAGSVKGLAVQDSTDTVYAASSNGKIYELRGIAVGKATTGDPIGNSTSRRMADPDGAGEHHRMLFRIRPHEHRPTPYGSKQDCEPGGGINAGESPSGRSLACRACWARKPTTTASCW